jgi:hypothetical protein
MPSVTNRQSRSVDGHESWELEGFRNTMKPFSAALLVLWLCLALGQQGIRQQGIPVTFVVSPAAQPASCPTTRVCLVSAITTDVPIISVFAQIYITGGDLIPDRLPPPTITTECESYIALPDVEVNFISMAWNASTLAGACSFVFFSTRVLVVVLPCPYRLRQDRGETTTAILPGWVPRPCPCFK